MMHRQSAERASAADVTAHPARCLIELDEATVDGIQSEEVISSGLSDWLYAAVVAQRLSQNR
jgi:hypothetical protein